MKLEDQVVSLELAIKLKDLGLKQDHLFVWTKDYENTAWYITSNPLVSSLDNDWYYHAYTVAELGEVMPDQLEKDGEFYDLVAVKIDENHWGVGYETDPPYRDESRSLVKLGTDSMVDSFAKVLIYLKENKLI